MLKIAMLAMITMAMAMETTFITEQLRIKLASSEYNTEFIEMLELSLKGGKIDDVIQMLQKMVDDLVGVQNSSNMEYTSRMAQYTNNIEQLEKNLETLALEAQNNNSFLGECSTQIAGLTLSLVSVKKQLATINEREESIRGAHTDEIAQNELRKTASSKVLAALELIHEKLTATLLNNSGSFLEVEEKNNLVNTIKQELGDRNPITLMVQLTTEFDEATARRVIEKLEEIINSIKGAEQSDSTNEQQSNSTYQAMLNEIQGLREKMGSEQQKTSSALKNKNNDLSISKRRAKELNKDLENTQILLQTNRLQKELLDSNHTSGSSKREAQLTTLKQALQILLDNADKLRK